MLYDLLVSIVDFLFDKVLRLITGCFLLRSDDSTVLKAYGFEFCLIREASCEMLRPGASSPLSI
jgi:hypothetical protein